MVAEILKIGLSWVGLGTLSVGVDSACLDVALARIELCSPVPGMKRISTASNLNDKTKKTSTHEPRSKIPYESMHVEPQIQLSASDGSLSLESLTR